MANDAGKPRYIGFYRNHAVRFFHDEGGDKPWRFVFEGAVVVGTAGNPQATLQWNDKPERDFDAAKEVALALAQERYGGPREEKWDEWLDLSQDKM